MTQPPFQAQGPQGQVPPQQHGAQLVPQGYGQPFPPQRPMPTAAPKSPGVAVILSLLVCGLGHLYTGNPLSAVFWFLSAVVCGLLIFVGIGLLLLPMAWIGACVHAYISASNFNRRHHAVR